MDITLKYERVDAFGLRVYTEDVCKSAKKSDLQIALRRLKKDRYAGVSIDNKTDKISFEAFKKRIYKQLEEV